MGEGQWSVRATSRCAGEEAEGLGKKDQHQLVLGGAAKTSLFLTPIFP
jgi:hypothetical protein